MHECQTIHLYVSDGQSENDKTCREEVHALKNIAAAERRNLRICGEECSKPQGKVERKFGRK